MLIQVYMYKWSGTTHWFVAVELQILLYLLINRCVESHDISVRTDSGKSKLNIGLQQHLAAGWTKLKAPDAGVFSQSKF